jgi:hypothetical protein
VLDRRGRLLCLWNGGRGGGRHLCGGGCGRRGRSVVDRDRFCPLTAKLQQVLLLLPPLSCTLLALLFDLSLQMFRLASAFFDDRGTFLQKPLDLAVNCGRLLIEAIVLEPLSLTFVKNCEEGNGRSAGHASLGIFADDDVIDPGHISDDDMRGLADLPIFDHGAIDADAAATQVLESVALGAHIHDLAPFDATSTESLDFLSPNTACAIDI